MERTNNPVAQASFIEEETLAWQPTGLEFLSISYLYSKISSLISGFLQSGQVALLMAHI